MLRNMQDALQEQAPPDADRLAKKLQTAEQELEQLMQDQERLQKKAQDAGRIAAPKQRQQELERLAREQERLQERARELAQRLMRQRGEQAAGELRRAARAMDQAREQLDTGSLAEDKQDEDDKGGCGQRRAELFTAHSLLLRGTALSGTRAASAGRDRRMRTRPPVRNKTMPKRSQSDILVK